MIECVDADLTATESPNAGTYRLQIPSFYFVFSVLY